MTQKNMHICLSPSLNIAPPLLNALFFRHDDVYPSPPAAAPLALLAGN